MKKNRKIRKEIILGIVIAAVVVLLAVWIGRLLAVKNSDVITAEGSGYIPKDNSIMYQGVKYQPNKDVDYILFMGIDDTEGQNTDGDIGNIGRTDTLILMMMNKKTQTVQLLEIPRDTMFDIDVYDKDGKFVYSGNMQINMQYAFGESPKRGCILTKKKVSELLYDIPIHHYIGLTMGGFADLVDSIGGITLTMEADYTEIDERYEQGKTIKLNGAEAERFVRYRDISVDASNVTRMERQTWFIQTMFAQMKANGSMNSMMKTFLNESDKTMETDIDTDTISDMVDYQLSENVLKLPGNYEAGDLHDEFHVDESALQKMIVENFYVPES